MSNTEYLIHFVIKINCTSIVAKITAGVKRPHDLSGQYQGDMVLTQQQWMLIKGIKPRAGIIDPARRWNGNVLPYIITGNFTEADVELIHESLEHIENATCLRFVEWTTEEDFIVVTVRYFLNLLNE